VPAGKKRQTCDDCSAAIKSYVAEMRKRRKTRHNLLRAVSEYEAAGTLAVERFAYVEAIAQFERALAGGPTPADEVRLCKKIGLAMFFGARPDFATPSYLRAIEICKTTPALVSSAPVLLNLLGQLKMLELLTQEALEICSDARQLAIDTDNRIDVRHANIILSQLHIDTGQLHNVHPYINKPVRGEATSVTQTGDWLVAARMSASSGRASAAFSNFEKALTAAKEIQDGSYATTVWDEYANCAVELGRLDLSRNCRENALFVARERRIMSRMPYLSVRMASTHLLCGEYAQARDLIRDALTYDTVLPITRVLLSAVGVKAGLILGDGALIDRTIDESMVNVAVRSGTQAYIAAIVAAHAQLYIARGDLRRGKALITRGIASINMADHAGDLLALTARFGSKPDAEKARYLLSQRIELPHSDVAQAYLALWHANDARRRRQEAEAGKHARAAATLFGRLGHQMQVADALSVAGLRPDAAAANSRATNQSLAQTELTPRERDVAELVLRGLSNRAIAETLAISVHTVESHVTSILNRLGVRSRWQIIEKSFS
jgi:DNA-binding CsgD family transcriptional regulator